MLRAGNTAIRTREWIEVLARKMGFDAVTVNISLDSISASVRRSGEWAMTMREIGRRVSMLGALPSWSCEDDRARTRAAQNRGQAYGNRVRDALVFQRANYRSRGRGKWCLYLSQGAAAAEMIAAAIGGGIGQCFRSWLLRRPLNQYGVAVL